MSRSPFQRFRDSLPIGRSTHRTNRRPHARRCLSFESLEGRELLAVSALPDFGSSSATGEKPQSKVWEYNDQWYAVMPDNGMWVWKLNGNQWQQHLQISQDGGYTADVKVVGNLAHIFLFDHTNSRLATIEYDHGSDNRYEMWSLRPSLVDVAVSGSAETAVIDVDTTGRMWVAYDTSSAIEVRYADLGTQYTNWSVPITVASGIKSDDIGSIIAMPNGSIGVMWSNQNTDRFGFRIHVDGAAPGTWLSPEVPASQSAQNKGGGMADDHINLAVASNGTLYAAVKTSYDSSGYPRISLLVRRPSGVWDNLYQVDSVGTRPIVVLNEVAGKLIVAYTQSDSGGNIYFKESSMNTISFGARQTLISGSVNNASSMKGNFTDEVVTIAGGGSKAKSSMFRFDGPVVAPPPPQNQAPNVSAGTDRTIQFPAGVALDGTVTDDGNPVGGSLTTGWTMGSGPGTVTFANANAIDTTATFSTAGTYVLRLTASDGLLSAFDEMTVTVASNDAPTTISFQDGVFPAISYQGTRDTKITSGSKNTNYGNAASLDFDGSPDVSDLLYWDTSAIPSGSMIESVTIQLNITNTSSQAYELYEMLRPWNELTATWNQAAAGVPWTTAGAMGAADRGSTVLGTITASSKGLHQITLNANGIAVVQAWINNPPSNNGLIIQDYSNSSGADFSSSEATTASLRPKLVVTYRAADGGTVGNPAPTNQAPIVNAGIDQTIQLPGTATLSGSVTDDGLPNSPGTVTRSWTKVSGPGTVSFANASSANTTASFSAAGTYVLRLTANDGALQAFDEISVTVLAAAAVNQAPAVNAGVDQSILLENSASLNGTVSDDGLPASPGSVTTTWSKISGPGTVTFGNASAVDTTATFSAEGTYVLRLTAFDGLLTAWDEVTVTVASNTAPISISFQDGLFPAISYQGTRDTKITSGSKNTNYGNAASLDFDGSPDISDLLYWDISAIPAGGVIESVAIQLNVTNTSGEAYELYVMQRAWDELTATWNQATSGNPWAAAGALGAADRGSTAVGAITASSLGLHQIALNASGIAAVQAWVDNPASNYGLIIQDYANSNGVDISSSEATATAQRPKLVVTYRPGGGGSAGAALLSSPVNLPPVIELGMSQRIRLPAMANLSATVTDTDGPRTTPLLLWTRVSGPGTVRFGDATAANTTAEFSTAGTYVLRLTADDGEFAVFAELTIIVDPAL